MVYGSGVTSKIGIGIQSEYGEAISLPSDCLFPVLTPDIGEEHDVEYVARKSENIGFGEGSVTGKKVSGDISLYHLFSGNNVLYDLIFGDPVARDTVESGVYRARYIPQDDVKFATYAEDTEVSVRNYDSLWVDGLNITGNPGDGIRVKLTCRSKKLDFDSPNSSSSSWEFWDSSPKVIMFEDSSFFIKEFSSSEAIDSADEFEISSFELNIRRNLFTKQTKISGTYLDTPVLQNYEIDGSFELPSYSSDTFLSLFRNNSLCMSKLEFTGSTITGKTSSYEFNIWLPTITLSPKAPVGGSKVIEQAIAFRCIRYGTLAAGFPYKSTEVIAETTNTNDGSYI